MMAYLYVCIYASMYVYAVACSSCTRKTWVVGKGRATEFSKGEREASCILVYTTQLLATSRVIQNPVSG